MPSSTAGNSPSIGTARVQVLPDITGFGPILSREIGQRATVIGGAFGAALAAPLGLAAGAAIRFEDAFAAVRKTVDLSDEGFEELEGAIRKMATEIPVAAEELSRFASIAGQLGITGVRALEKFTETIARLSVSVDGLDAEQAALSLARFINVTGRNFEEVDKLAAGLVDLGNKFAANEAEILKFSQLLAGAGSVIGLTQAEIFGLATALASAGIAPERAGSSFSRLFLTMGAAADEGGAKLQVFAELAGKTAVQMAEFIKSSPAEAIQAILGGFRDIAEASPARAISILKDLGLNTERVRDVMFRTSAAVDQMGEAVTTATEGIADGTALIVESSRRFETTASRIQILKNTFNELGITIGEQLRPVLNIVITGLTAFLNIIKSIPQPVLVGLTVFAGLAGSVIAVGSAFLYSGQHLARLVATFRKSRELGGFIPLFKGMSRTILQAGSDMQLTSAEFIKLNKAASARSGFRGVLKDFAGGGLRQTQQGLSRLALLTGDSQAAMEKLRKTASFERGGLGGAFSRLSGVFGRTTKDLSQVGGVAVSASRGLGVLRTTASFSGTGIGGVFSRLGGILQRTSADMLSIGRNALTSSQGLGALRSTASFSGNGLGGIFTRLGSVFSRSTTSLSQVGRAAIGAQKSVEALRTSSSGVGGIFTRLGGIFGRTNSSLRTSGQTAGKVASQWSALRASSSFSGNGLGGIFTRLRGTFSSTNAVLSNVGRTALGTAAQLNILRTTASYTGGGIGGIFTRLQGTFSQTSNAISRAGLGVAAANTQMGFFSRTMGSVRKAFTGVAPIIGTTSLGISRIGINSGQAAGQGIAKLGAALGTGARGLAGILSTFVGSGGLFLAFTAGIALFIAHMDRVKKSSQNAGEAVKELAGTLGLATDGVKILREQAKEDIVINVSLQQENPEQLRELRQLPREFRELEALKLIAEFQWAGSTPAEALAAAKEIFAAAGVEFPVDIIIGGFRGTDTRIIAETEALVSQMEEIFERGGEFFTRPDNAWADTESKELVGRIDEIGAAMNRLHTLGRDDDAIIFWKDFSDALASSDISLANQNLIQEALIKNLRDVHGIIPPTVKGIFSFEEAMQALVRANSDGTKSFHGLRFVNGQWQAQAETGISIINRQEEALEGAAGAAEEMSGIDPFAGMSPEEAEEAAAALQKVTEALIGGAPIWGDYAGAVTVNVDDITNSLHEYVRDQQEWSVLSAGLSEFLSESTLEALEGLSVGQKAALVQLGQDAPTELNRLLGHYEQAFGHDLPLIAAGGLTSLEGTLADEELFSIFNSHPLEGFDYTEMEAAHVEKMAQIQAITEKGIADGLSSEEVNKLIAAAFSDAPPINLFNPLAGKLKDDAAISLPPVLASSLRNLSANTAVREAVASTGLSLSRGIGTGFSVDVLYKAMASKIRVAITRVSDEFGIKSPSTYTAKYVGLPLGQGVAVGITKAIPESVAAYKALVGALETEGGGPSKFSPTPPPVAQTAVQSVAARTSPVTTEGGNRIYNLTINNPDTHDLARDSERFLGVIRTTELMDL